MSALIATVSAIAAIVYFTTDERNVCDLKISINRDFNVFYGLKYIVNPFSIFDAEKNSQADLFEPIIAENMKHSSMIVQGEKGSGKTHIRQYRLSKMKSNSIPIELYGNMGINKYLKLFLENIDTTQTNQEKLVKHFNKVDFMHIMLTEMVDKIYKMKYKEVVANFDNWNFAQRLNIANILAFYASSNIENKDIINELLKEKTKCTYCFSRPLIDQLK